MAKGSALFLVPESPYPSHGGGALRSASLLEYLAGRYEVDVIEFLEPGAVGRAPYPAGVAREICSIELPRHEKTAVARGVRNVGRILRGVPPLVDRFGGFGNEIEAFIRRRSYEVAVVEHFWCAPYWEQIAPRSRKTVLNLHNIESVLHARCARSTRGPAVIAHAVFEEACRELELRWLPCYDCLLTSSDADARIATAISPGSKAIVLPNTIPWVAEPAIRERELIAFSGNMEYHPNTDAVRFFHDEIWPGLRSAWPHLVWRLIGKNPQTIRKYVNGDARIEISGPVEDAITELAAARVAVVPLLAGSGTRFKVIEAWAAGRAVVSTRIGAEGLPARHGENMLLADDARAFGASVSQLLTSPVLRRKLGQMGRKLFEAEFTHQAAWKKLDL